MFLTIAGICTILASCTKTGFLENKTSSLDETAVFSDSLRTIQFLNYIYSGGSGSNDQKGIGFVFNKGRWDTHGNTEHSTDDAEYLFSSVIRPDVILYNGTISPTNFGGTNPTLADSWKVPYDNIRRCNLLMQQLPNTPLSAATQSRVRGQAKCLRAWYYMQLLICYGGVPNAKDSVYGIEDLVNLPRQHFADLVTYLSNELDEAATLLPDANVSSGGYDAVDYGRVTKGTCLGLKSRLLLWAASPLFNGGNYTTASASEEQIACAVYPTYSAARWQAAADAALAVINYGHYSLMVDNSQPGLGFYKTFLTRVKQELIFAYYRPTNKDFENYYYISSVNGSGYSRPTHNQRHAYTAFIH